MVTKTRADKNGSDRKPQGLGSDKTLFLVLRPDGSIRINPMIFDSLSHFPLSYAQLCFHPPAPAQTT
jgi:hypothetical protein